MSANVSTSNTNLDSRLGSPAEDSGLDLRPLTSRDVVGGVAVCGCD